MRFLARWILRLLFGFRAYNTEVLSTPGPVLLAPNHVSWLDWLFLGACLDDNWRFVTSSVTAQSSWLHRFIMVNRLTFPIDTSSPYAVKRMAEFLESGGRLVLFSEGRISRTGVLMKLFDGTGFLLFKTKARVITCYLRGANRLPFSPHSGWKKLFPRVTAHFSAPLTPPEIPHASTAQARERLTAWLRDQITTQQFNIEMEFGPAHALSAVVEMAAQRPGQVILEDMSRQQLTYTKLLLGAELLSRKLEPMLLPHLEKVGVLLPNVNATPVLTLALWSLNKTPAILNFSTGIATMLACVDLAGLKQIVTSRVFLERAKIDPKPFVNHGIQILYLDDIREQITAKEKLATLFQVSFNPSLLERRLPRHFGSANPSAVVLFTSGSEGAPKGVELSHQNVLANIRQLLAIADLQDHDRVFNCLPLFHSFGFTIGTLLPLVRGMYVFIYPSPLHYRVIPTAFYDRECTIFLSTNTFLNGYARKAHPYDFRSLRYLFAAAEKLQESTARLWADRFGVRILEGYGATECSPAISLNTPLAPRYGSVGRPLPGVECRIEPVPGVTEGGRLFVRGPNVMLGYLNPEANDRFKADHGWYDTGDIVSLDADGYLYVKGRLKRFAKISGEMVSLTAVEEALAGSFPHYGLRFQIAVISRPDPEKGEALIAVTNEPKLTIDEIRQALRQKGLSNLWVPREIKVVREIPKLGTGKTNHRALEKTLDETP